MALRSRVTPTRTLGTQVRSRYNLLLPRGGPKTVPSPYHCLRHHITDTPPPVNTNTQVTNTSPTLRPCHLHHASDSAVSARTDPLTGTIIQKCGGTRTRGTNNGYSVPLKLAPLTDILPRVWVPLDSVLAWSACLLSMNSHSMTARVMPTNNLRAHSRLVCAPNLDKLRTLGLRPRS